MNLNLQAFFYTPRPEAMYEAEGVFIRKSGCLPDWPDKQSGLQLHTRMLGLPITFLKSHNSKKYQQYLIKIYQRS